MARSDRLFRLLHCIRSLPQPVTAARLAAALEVSERTLYRDIDALRLAGARIEGAAGLGYTMIEDIALPPQTFTQLEIEALVLGLGEVQFRGDTALAEAARDALTKITATLPDRQQRQVTHAAGLVRRWDRNPDSAIDLAIIRQACWDECALDICYTDRSGRDSARRIYPLAVVYLQERVMVLAWCCLRDDFRHFLVASIRAHRLSEESFRPRRVILLRRFMAQMRARAGGGGVPAPP
ncbi:HTH domain protein [Aquimixticola soesokkakensis]|uniref:HTH domain protein n=1 Tax=Aquimixticola soesokkakensis TaxID=1519096 RepID=A0A1Y5TJ71_9RHOB|nr:YafY family protein [Aquimixticola soesokkakensis]SLN65387.1 HTH domain protein [Aquimixticola soesokkakensis]